MRCRIADLTWIKADNPDPVDSLTQRRRVTWVRHSITGIFLTD